MEKIARFVIAVLENWPRMLIRTSCIDGSAIYGFGERKSRLIVVGIGHMIYTSE